MISLLLPVALFQGTSAPIDFAKAWGEVSKAITRSYYGRVSKKASMDSLLSMYGPIASAAPSADAFEGTVNDMIRQFGDSHFEFYTKKQQGYYLMQNLTASRDAQEKMPEIGAWFRRSQDTYTVQMVLEGSEAAKVGMRKGDVMETADGEPFSPVAALQDKVDKTVHLAFERNGQQMAVDCHVESASGLGMFLDASRASTRIIESHGKKIGYFHLWTMASDDFRNVLAGAVGGTLKNTDAMILDIRDGFGGRPEGFGDPFFRPQVLLEWKSPAMDNKEMFGYQKPLVVLINGGSRSAKEVFAYIFKTSKRATLIGSTTAGNVLGTAPMRLNDWSYLEIPMVELTVDGVTLEKNGVKPDIAVPEESDADGHDLDIARAVDFLTK